MSTQAYPDPQMIFQHQYAAVKRDEVVGVLLALFLGAFGAHHFYLRRTGLGILYLSLFWTGISSLLGLIECFFMPGRVREFNAIQAGMIAAMLGIQPPMWGQAGFGGMPPAAPQAGVLQACVQCGHTNPPAARFCGGCGGSLVANEAAPVAQGE